MDWKIKFITEEDFIEHVRATIEKYGDSDKNIIILAHGEEVPQQDGRIYLKMKTTGKMVR